MYSYNPYYGTYLSHFGVKGMKWGVRKDRVRSNKNKKKVKKTYKKEVAIKKGHADSALKDFEKYSTQELREVRERAFLKRDLESISNPKKERKVSNLIGNTNTDVKNLVGIATGAAALAAIIYATKTKGVGAVVNKSMKRFVD